MHTSKKKKKSLIEIAEKRERKRKAKNKKVYIDGVNQRANIKQRQVSNVFKQVFGEKCEVEELDLCKKKLYFSDLEYIDYLDMFYYTNNTLFARVFDLILRTTFEGACTKAPTISFEKNIDIGITFSGSIRIKNAEFQPYEGENLASNLAKKLNSNDLVHKRILFLEAVDIKIKYDCETKRWSVGLGTGKGSTVWSLIPPVVMLVKFTEEDVVKLAELFQIIICEIKSFEKSYDIQQGA